MVLKFHPVGDLLAFVPGTGVGGQPSRYVGRRFNPKTEKFEATEAPFECEEGTERAHRMAKLARRGEVLVADEFTAKACGLQFIAHELKGGVFVPKEAKKSRGGDS